MILYSVASPPLTLPTYPFSHYVMCIAGCVLRRNREATLSTWLPMPAVHAYVYKLSLGLSFFFIFVFTLPNIGLTLPGTYNSNDHGSDACMGRETMNQNSRQEKRAGLPEPMVSRMTGPQPEPTQDRKQRTRPILGYKLKSLTPPGNEPGPSG